MVSLDRRRFLHLGGVAGVAALAGCGGQTGDGTDTGTATDQAEPAGDATATDGDDETLQYTWTDATWDSYWYSLYNMSTNIAMSGNGVQFPHNDEQQAAFEDATH